MKYIVFALGLSIYVLPTAAQQATGKEPAAVKYERWNYSLISTAPTATIARQITILNDNPGFDPLPTDKTVFRKANYQYGIFMLHEPKVIKAHTRSANYPSYRSLIIPYN